MSGFNFASPVPYLSPEQIAQAEKHVRRTSKMPISDFKISVSVLLFIAFLTFIGRIFIRLLSRRRLFLDDTCLLVAFVCLVIPIAIFPRLHLLYLEAGILRRDDEALSLVNVYRDQLYNQSKWHIVFYAPLWTAIFMVKGCYFAFFHPFLKLMSKRFIGFYWAAVSLTAVSWVALAFVEQTVICPHVGEESAKCYDDPNALMRKMGALTWVCTTLDGVTDLIVITIPIFFLQKSRMPLLTKLGLGLFLCLSTCMLLCAVVRCVVIKLSHVPFDLPLPYWWLYAEACIAVTMGSLTVYRSTLVGSNSVTDGFQACIARIRGRKSDGQEEATDPESGQESDFKLQGMKLPGPTLTGFRTMFGIEVTETDLKSMDTAVDEFDLVAVDYHTHISKEMSNDILDEKKAMRRSDF